MPRNDHDREHGHRHGHGHGHGLDKGRNESSSPLGISVQADTIDYCGVDRLAAQALLDEFVRLVS